MTLRRSDLFGYALVLPAMLLVLGFIIYPVGEVIRLSFTNTSLLAGRSDFVGLQSYQRVLSDPLMGHVLSNTATWVFLGTALALLLGLGVGYFLSFNFWINRILRACILLPWILPAVVSVASWRWMYAAEGGILNDVLLRAGLIQKVIPWLGDPSLVMYALVVIAVWRHLPFASLVVSAAVQGIPTSYVEAATIDGANGWQKFWRITLPLLRPVSAITILLGLVYTLKVFDLIWIMTRGGPADSSTTFAIWAYRLGFGSLLPDFSPAAAVGNLLILVALIFGLIYIRTQSRLDPV